MPRRTPEAAAETRSGVLAAARELISRAGFSATSADEIAAAAGVTRGAVYHHFGDKRELFRAVFEELEAELDAAARRGALAADSPDPLERFLAGSRAFLDFAARPDYHRISRVEAPAVLGARPGQMIDRRAGLGGVERALGHMIKHGRIRAQPVRPLAVLVFGALNEAGLAIARHEPGIDTDSALAGLRQLLDPASA